jgi:group I intron endonuclease
MKPYGIIYKSTNRTNGKVYVGQTVQSLRARIKDHRNSVSKHPQLALYRAFTKYGFETFDWEVIEHATSKGKLDEKERRFIEQYRSVNARYGYNMTFGGEGGKHTEEVKLKISASNKGRRKSESERKKLSDSLMGKYTKEKASWWGRRHTEEEKQKISEAQRGAKNHNFGKKASLETRRKKSEAIRGEKHWNHKRVVNLDSGEVFVSAMHAREKTGIDNSLIGKCCKGQRRSAGGFRWAFWHAGL